MASDASAASDVSATVEHTAHALGAVDNVDRADSVDREERLNEEDVRRHAYHLYLERGGGHGRDFDDWVRAEQELKQKR